VTGMVQTDFGPLALSKYKEEPVDDSVSTRSISYLSALNAHYSSLPYAFSSP
jgi:hypothetical protein